MMHLAYGGKSPSGRDTPDRGLYEMSLDTGWTPDQIRGMNPRDRNKLALVKDARVLARKQRSQKFGDD